MRSFEWPLQSRLLWRTGELCLSGWTLTPMTKKYLRDAAKVKRLFATMALPQIAEPEDVAHAVAFLASDTLARHVTGQILVVAGGMEGRWLWQPEELALPPGSVLTS